MARDISLRHRIAHGYETVDHRLIWQIVRQDLPALAIAMEALQPRGHDNPSPKCQHNSAVRPGSFSKSIPTFAAHSRPPMAREFRLGAAAFDRGSRIVSSSPTAQHIGHPRHANSAIPTSAREISN